MTATLKTLVLAALAACAIGAHAVTFTVPTVFNGVTWTYSSNVSGQGDCNQLVLDATGDMNQGFGLGLHGFLNCTNGSYAVSGTAYFSTSRNLNMTFQTGVGILLVCNGLPLSTLSGPCLAYNGNGVQLGTGAISLLQ
jgi:hypothetical protein